MHRGIRAFAVTAFFSILLATPVASQAQNGTLTFLHFNDVYEIAPQDGMGGFGELKTVLDRERSRNPEAITVVSGDFLSPSLLSGLTQGRQMVELFNAVGVDYVTFGNHEFDFGPEATRQRIAESTFQWLATNVLDGGTPMGVATASRQVGDIKVGFIGLVTPETEELSSPGESVDILPVMEAARTAVERLEAEGAHVVVAVTHLTIAEDRELARQVKGLDLILGGHEHEPITWMENGVLIQKSGEDAFWLGAIDLMVETTQGSKGPVTKVTPQWRMHAVADVAPDPAVQAIVDRWNAKLDAELGIVIGRTDTEIDSRRDTVRTQEAAIGNLIADALRDRLKADVAITNGGGIRGNAVYPADSELTRKHVFAELPFGNTAVLIELAGADLREALENGVSAVEDKAGRFPQVSGMTVTYDPQAEKGRRVKQVTVGGKPLDPAAIYRVATNDYLYGGGDGYTALRRGKPLIDPSGAILMATIVMEHIEARKTVAPKVEGRIATQP